MTVEVIDRVCCWWLNRRTRAIEQMLNDTAGPADQEEERERRRCDLLESVLRGELARRRLRDEYPDEAEAEFWVGHMADTVERLVDQDAFQQSVLRDIDSLGGSA